VVADGVGVVPDDVTTRSDTGEESIVSAWEVNRDEFASGQEKAMVFYPCSSSHTRLRPIVMILSGSRSIRSHETKRKQQKC